LTPPSRGPRPSWPRARSCWPGLAETQHHLSSKAVGKHALGGASACPSAPNTCYTHMRVTTRPPPTPSHAIHCRLPLKHTQCALTTARSSSLVHACQQLPIAPTPKPLLGTRAATHSSAQGSPGRRSVITTPESSGVPRNAQGPHHPRVIAPHGCCWCWRCVCCGHRRGGPSRRRRRPRRLRAGSALRGAAGLQAGRV